MVATFACGKSCGRDFAEHECQTFPNNVCVALLNQRSGVIIVPPSGGDACQARPCWSQIGQPYIGRFRPRGNFGRTRSNFAHISHRRPKVAKHWPKPAKLWLPPANFDRGWPLESGQAWPRFERSWPELGRIRPNSGRSRQKYGNLGNRGPDSGERTPRVCGIAMHGA